jgi:hypothetical protein
MSERASIFDNSTELDLSGFAPKKKPKTEIPAEAVRAVAETAQFRSREPAPTAKKPPAQKEPRRYVTGRNVQLSVKVSSETRDAFYALADSQKWVLGVALEKAVAALQRELAAE